jgi:hypothetical protein
VILLSVFAFIFHFYNLRSINSTPSLRIVSWPAVVPADQDQALTWHVQTTSDVSGTGTDPVRAVLNNPERPVAAAVAGIIVDDSARVPVVEAPKAGPKPVVAGSARKQAKPAAVDAVTPPLELPGDAAGVSNTATAAPTCNYDDICKLERAERYEEAFALYEERADTCGDQGWETIRVLGEGMSGRVRLRKTPCGLRIAAKEPPAGGNSIGSFQLLKQHIEVDCKVIKALDAHRAACNNCFPKYYYFSDKTGVCYNEFIDSQPLPKFIKRLNISTSDGLEALKLALLQVRVLSGLDVCLSSRPRCCMLSLLTLGLSKPRCTTAAHVHTVDVQQCHRCTHSFTASSRCTARCVVRSACILAHLTVVFVYLY